MAPGLGVGISGAPADTCAISPSAAGVVVAFSFRLLSRVREALVQLLALLDCIQTEHEYKIDPTSATSNVMPVGKLDSDAAPLARLLHHSNRTSSSLSRIVS